jgi:hypothetical protein
MPTPLPPPLNLLHNQIFLEKFGSLFFFDE